jgi:hypothetical protein
MVGNDGFLILQRDTNSKEVGIEIRFCDLDSKAVVSG